MTLTSYCRTVSRLRWSQLLWRLRYSLERRCGDRGLAWRWRWVGTEPPRSRDDVPALPVFHCPAESNPQSVALLRKGRFHHLNVEQALGLRPDWQLGSRRTERLWTITLHYHAWAYALAAAVEDSDDLLRHYLDDWMTRCTLDTPGARALAWNSYAIATRLGWWMRIHALLGKKWCRERSAFHRAFLESAWRQSAYLFAHLEWDLRGNHLLRDAVGLALAGRFFAEKQARTWLTAATRLARQQTREQILPDGGHFERSPMYHLHVMEDVCTLALLVEDESVRAELRERWRCMADYLAWMRHPDGDIPLFNDGGLQSACAPVHMLQLGKRLGMAIDDAPRRGGRWFADSGMIVWHGHPWSLFYDVGALGPDYQPGHGHADTLTVECSYQGRRLFVDPGVFGYDNDAQRRYDRSTEAHNTVCIDGQDSSEMWHIFRVGRRAYPLDVVAHCSATELTAEASHTGYDHLPGRPRHQRCIVVTDNGGLAIADRIRGGGAHVLQGGFLLAPSWRPSSCGGGWLLSDGTHQLRLHVRGPHGLTLFDEARSYHPRYGEELATWRLGWRIETTLPVEITVDVERT
jgi:uncharacterized heparinase superfamily protein